MSCRSPSCSLLACNIVVLYANAVAVPLILGTALKLPKDRVNVLRYQASRHHERQTEHIAQQIGRRPRRRIEVVYKEDDPHRRENVESLTRSNRPLMAGDVVVKEVE